MPSREKKYTADSFKKDAISENYDNGENGTKKRRTKKKRDVIQKEASEAGRTPNGKTSNVDEAPSDDEVQCDNATLSVNETSDVTENEQIFNNEDSLISKLYSNVVDDIMQVKNFEKSTVDRATREMKIKMCIAYYKNPLLFSEIDFSRAANRCGYLKRYAVCHTGLVKNAVFQFFVCTEKNAKTSKEEIINNEHLKVVSLGGGPGNDLVGFCSALQEVPNEVKELDLVVLDISRGWKSVFPTILEKAKGSFGSFTQFLKKKVNPHFRKVDLTNPLEIQDENVCVFLRQADVLLMVKLASFLCNEDARDLINNVVDCMKPEAKLIFIDSPYRQELGKIKSLETIYHVFIKHELGFKPTAFTYPILRSSADVAIYRKKMILADSSTDSEET